VKASGELIEEGNLNQMTDEADKAEKSKKGT
jgi:hypothetical protein